MADAEFLAPTVGSAFYAETDFWGGIGGAGNVTSPTVIVQAGLEMSDHQGVPFYDGWIEVYPNVPPLYNFACISTTEPGDYLAFYVESNLNSDGYDYFLLMNDTASCYDSCTVHTTNSAVQDTCGFTGGPSYNSDGGTGECIAEKGGDWFGTASLAEWNPPSDVMQFDECSSNNGPGYTLTGLAGLPHYRDSIYDSNGQLLAEPDQTFVNAVTFGENWKQGT